MASVEIRFFGRFVIAHEMVGGVLTGKVTFLAPDMTAGKFARHVPVMSIPRAAVSRAQGETTLAPTYRVVTPGAPAEAELFVWDLTGCNVRVVSSGGLHLEFEDPIASLELLEKKVGRTPTFDKNNIGAGRLVNAAIQIAGGQGSATAAFSNSVDFLTLTDAMDGNPNNDVILHHEEPAADLVQIFLAGGTRVMEIIKGGVKYLVTVRLESSTSTSVSFTNLCSCIPQVERYDFEFGQYYEVLQAAYPDRLIPIVSHLGDAADCDMMTQITYEA